MSQPHFIVFANEKGGTGKSTTAVHAAIALAASGHRVGALDLDHRQRTMTRYLENRATTLVRLEEELPSAVFEAGFGRILEHFEGGAGKLFVEPDQRRGAVLEVASHGPLAMIGRASCRERVYLCV